MRIAEINILTNGSTGRIMLQIAEKARLQGHWVKTYTPIRFVRGKKIQSPNISNHFCWGSRLEACFHYYAGILFGRNGMYSFWGTKQLIKDLKRFKPDIIHLHNLHMFCINLPMLFRYIKRNNIKVIWTLHDCWAFTGHCSHFLVKKCDKWKTGCHHCPQPWVYPEMFIDTSKKMWQLKKRLFCGINDMTIVVPSEWLGKLVKQSFLKEYSVVLINNGIDLSIFKPTPSDFREKYALEDKKIVLGVSFGWNNRKGLDIFLELSKRLSESYKIVLVGIDEDVASKISENIVCINRTENQVELAKIYTAADVFLIPTREDTYPTVSIEALACGTPVVTFNVGGSPEIIDDTCGCVVDVDDIDAIHREIVRICSDIPYSSDACIKRAQKFDSTDRYEEYILLYRELY